MKKLSLLFLVLFISTGLLLSNGVQIGDLYYLLDETNHTAQVTYSVNNLLYIDQNYNGLTSANIPETVEYEDVTYTVTSIGNLAFACHSTITSISIPETVTEIGTQAFDNYEETGVLSSITMGSNVTSIGEWAFRNNIHLTSITIPTALTSITTQAFVDCTNLKSITWNAINGPCTSFGSQVESFTFGNQVETIPASLCAGMTNLISITIPASVTNIGDKAFSNCTSLTSIVVESGNTRYDSRNNCNAIIETATNTLVVGCQNTTIPNNVTSIGANAFYDLYLMNYTIPSHITTIGENAFKNAFNIYYTGTAEGSPWGALCVNGYAEGMFIYRDNTKTELVGCSPTITGTLTIPNGVSSIGEYAFINCEGLTSVIIPENLTSLGRCAFEGCPNISSITWNAINCSITDFSASYKVQEAPFYSCRENITQFTLGNLVENIPHHLCYGMNSLTSIAISNSVTSIGDDAFHNCSGLTSITIPNSVISIEKSAFSGCKGLTSVTIGNNVTNIGDKTFYGCSNITSVIWNAKRCADKGNFGAQVTSFIFGSEVETIPGSCCNGMSKLTSIIIPNSVTSIGGWAFADCSGLTSVTIPNNVTSIGEGSFAGCSSLTSMVVENGNTVYDSRNNCNAIIETSTNTLFSGCKNTIIPNSVISIGTYAFKSCSGLTSIEIPNSVTSIGSEAFWGCKGLTSITIPNSVTSIGRSAFYGCSGLVSITCLGETPATIGSNAFPNQNVSIYVPCGKVDVYKSRWISYTYYIKQQGVPYSVTGRTTDATMGSVNAPTLSCESEIEISAIPNYGYHFVKWTDGNTDNPRTISLTQDTTFTAEFAKNTYSITTASSNPGWGSTTGDGSVLYLEEIEISATPNNGYHFVAWSDGNTDNPRTILVTKDSILTAIFAVNQYTITFLNEDGTILSSQLWNYGTTPTCDEPTKPATAQYIYTFAGWDSEVVAVTGDATYTATYTATVRKYTITFLDEDGTILSSQLWNYGTTPTCDEPTKPATAQYTYTFAGWDSEVVAVTGDATYTATYTATVRKYVITFLDEDGTVLSSQRLNYGAMPTCDEPTKPATAQYIYTFAGWDPEVVIVTGSATYIATYTATPITTEIQNVTSSEKQATKTIRNGVLYIERNGKTYNAQGARIK